MMQLFCLESITRACVNIYNTNGERVVQQSRTKSPVPKVSHDSRIRSISNLSSFTAEHVHMSSNATVNVEE